MEIEIWNCDEDDTDDATVLTTIDDVCVDNYFNDEDGEIEDFDDDDDGVNFFFVSQIWILL